MTGADGRPDGPRHATVFGAGGFVGRHLVAHLEARGVACSPVLRGDQSWRERALGHVFYCIGLTADFRTRPFDTIDAHVSQLAEVLGHGRFDSLVYLSSTRVYAGAASTAEDASLTVNPNHPGDLYNLSKLAGEALALSLARPSVRVARLSNVHGPDFGSSNFLMSIIRDAVATGRIDLATTLDSAKDYVAIDDVVAALAHIAFDGRHRLYNVASGVNATHGEIVETLADLTGCRVTVSASATRQRFPRIVTDRLGSEFKHSFVSVLQQLPILVAACRA